MNQEYQHHKYVKMREEMHRATEPLIRLLAEMHVRHGKMQLTVAPDGSAEMTTTFSPEVQKTILQIETLVKTVQDSIMDSCFPIKRLRFWEPGYAEQQRAELIEAGMDPDAIAEEDRADSIRDRQQNEP